MQKSFIYTGGNFLYRGAHESKRDFQENKITFENLLKRPCKVLAVNGEEFPYQMNGASLQKIAHKNTLISTKGWVGGGISSSF